MLHLFSLEKLTFPQNFQWGTATAAHQIEGGDDASHDSWWEALSQFEQCSGKACDHWNLYREDIGLMSSLGYPFYRMSLSWARLNPEPGKFDHEAMARYQQELQLLKDSNIKVMLTLYHGSDPRWFVAAGRFSLRKNVQYFLDYVEFVVPRIAGLVDSVLIINEFNLRTGTDLAAGGNDMANYLLAHAGGYRIVKEHSRLPVSSAHALVTPEPENQFDRFDVMASRQEDWMRNEFFFHAIRTGEFLFPGCDAEVLPDVKDSLDFWGVNYYCRKIVSARRAKSGVTPAPFERLKMIDLDFYCENFYPQGLRDQLLRLSDKPVCITENGVHADDDRWRMIKMVADLAAIHDAINRGVDVIGYYHWSFMDNYEWTTFLPRFGLVHVDFQTMARTPKPSARFYGDIIRENAISGELLRQYIPECPSLTLYGENGKTARPRCEKTL